MLNRVKLDLRITHNKLDDNIQESIDACFADLRRIGIISYDDTDPLIMQLVKFYCRYQYNYNGEAGRYRHAYEMLRNAVSLDGDYFE